MVHRCRLWAAENGITDGTSETTFSPNDALTREQMATFLYRFANFEAGEPIEVTGDLSGYTDADLVADYAVDAMTWAVGERDLGIGNNTLAPDNTASRAQMATVLTRYTLSKNGTCTAPVGQTRDPAPMGSGPVLSLASCHAPSGKTGIEKPPREDPGGLAVGYDGGSKWVGWRCRSQCSYHPAGPGVRLMFTCLISWYSSRPWTPSSRPMPDIL